MARATQIGTTRTLEFPALAAGVLAAALLGGVAWSPAVDPGIAGEAELSRQAGIVAGRVVEEWQRTVREEGWGRGETLRYSPDHLRENPRFQRYRQESPNSGSSDSTPAGDSAEKVSQTPFGLFWRESEEFERGGDIEQALSSMVEARNVAADPEPTARALLRSVQLSLRVDEGKRVPDFWTDARSSVRPSLADDDGISFVLLIALAAAPALSAADRLDARSSLVDDWVSGLLALPEWRVEITRTPAGGIEPAVPATLALVVKRLQGLGDSGDDPRLAEDLTLRFLAAVDRTLDGLPEIATSTWKLRFLSEHVFTWRSEEPGIIEGCFLTRSELEQGVRQRGLDLQDLEGGFHLDFSGNGDDLGEVVLDRTALTGNDFGFVLRHEDPEGIVRAGGKRIRYLRQGLSVLAVFCLLASIATARALRRERRLQQLKSDFVANVSHELRTPLSSILLMAENLESGAVTDPAALGRYHSWIHREARRLGSLVDDVLDFSRLERGKGPRIRLEETGLNELFEEITRDSAELARQNGGEVTVHGGAPSGLARVDREALRRAVLNLVDNALLHGGGAVELSASGGAELEIVVADRGPGLRDEQLAHMFEPFQRFPQAEGVRGTGLGLAIVQEIARGHGGEVRARRRKEGTGLEIRLKIPVPTGEQTPGTSNGNGNGNGNGARAENPS